MAYHRSVPESLQETLYDSGLEDGELPEDAAMDLDEFDGRNAGDEEGESLEEFEKFTGQQANHRSGEGKNLTRKPRRKKSKKKRGSGPRVRNVNLPQFVRETCAHLQEKKYPLIWAAVKTLGVETVKNLIKEVDVIERCGGQLTNDGKRRRTPGGVLWNILRSQQPAEYKEIMAQGNEVQKQKDAKVKESRKRMRMDVDEEPRSKRRHLDTNEEDMGEPGALRKQASKLQQLPRPANILLDDIEVPENDGSLPPGIQLQRAWVEGIQKKEKVDEAAVRPVSSVADKREFSKVGTVTAGIQERLRVPVAYGDLDTEEQ